MTPAPPAAEAWTTRRLLEWMSGAFAHKDLDSPRLFAEMLMAHVIGCQRLRLYMEPDRPASPDEREKLRSMVKRALDHEPVQYLVGEAMFFGMAFAVDRRVLIPRPETVVIVEAALAYAKDSGGLNQPTGEGTLIADLGTGSGAIAVALAKHLTHARVVACDISADALDVAGANAERHGVAQRVDLARGDLYDALDAHDVAQRSRSIHILTSNPPYIPDDEWDGGLVDRNVKDHEPELALRGGPDGLHLIRPIVAGAPDRLAPGGLLLIEFAESRADAVLHLARTTAGLERARIIRDQDAKPRVLEARRVR